MAKEHPSNNIAANIDKYFAAPAVEDNVSMQTKLESLETDYRALANKLVSDVCDCIDRASSMQRLRESFELSTSSVVNEPRGDESWPPAP